MKHLRIIIAVLAIMACRAGATAETADQLLNRVENWCKEKKSVESDYTVSAGDDTFAGTIVVNGNRFAIRSAVMDTWYDGKNQWTYNPEVNEVTITEPTGEEIQQINPFAIIAAFRHAYSATMAAEKPGAKASTVILTPKQDNIDIKRVEIAVPKGESYPVRLVLTMANGAKCVITMKRFVRGVAYNDGTFRYNEKSHPTAKTIDLR